mgnify:CR=1 FL=1
MNELNSSEWQCAFVRLNPACTYSGVLYNYMAMTFCDLNFSTTTAVSLRPLAIVIVVLLLLFMFLCISLVADEL